MKKQVINILHHGGALGSNLQANKPQFYFVNYSEKYNNNLIWLLRGIVYSSIAIILMTNKLKAQSLKWPDRNYSKGAARIYNDSPIQNGYIVFNNGDTVKGEIKIPPSFDFSFCSILPEGKDRITKNVIDIYPNKIRFIRVYGGTKFVDSTDFMPLTYNGRLRLWRLLGKKKSIAIYDDAAQTYDDSVSGFEYQEPLKNKYYASTMLLFNGNNKIVIFGRPRFSDAYSLILKFINNRYGMKLSKGSFKSTSDLMEYILNSEIKKISEPLISLNLNVLAY